jgi:hypothetical protein
VSLEIRHTDTAAAVAAAAVETGSSNGLDAELEEAAVVLRVLHLHVGL